MRAMGATRGKGLLENFLASRRERVANRIIGTRAPASYRLLDIGCGSFPFFLSRSPFRERYGLDQFVDGEVAGGLARSGISLLRHDVEKSEHLPFPDAFFNVVTMLAVFEHIRRAKLPGLIAEIHRVLRPHGIYFLTTPAHWTGPILDTLARCGLVSSVEIEEHQDTYTHHRIASILAAGGFESGTVEYGSFELGMNLWACAVKPAAVANVAAARGLGSAEARNGRKWIRIA